VFGLKFETNNTQQKISPSLDQGCQMVHFQTKNRIWVNFGGP
jgi:hypothetical protein